MTSLPGRRKRARARCQLLARDEHLAIRCRPPAGAVGALDGSQPPAEGSTAFKAMLQRYVHHSASAMAFVWLSTLFAAAAAAGRTRSAEVQAGRAYKRLQLKATELGLQVHPMSHTLQEFAEPKPAHDRLHQALLGQPATQQVVLIVALPAPALTPPKASPA